MAAKVCVFTGPARSGKTAALLKHYRQLLTEQPDGNASGAALWIAPTKCSAAEIRECLLQDGLVGCFSPGICTFEQFAQALLAASDEPPRYLGRLLKRQLILRLLIEAKTAGRLNYFSPIAETPGLLDLIDGLISDLKRQEVWPDKFSELIQSVAPSEKNHEIAALYTEYQNLLDRHQMHDIEGRFWSAGKFLRETPPERWGPVANVKHIMIDGFTDFTRSQQEVLRLLATRATQLEDLTITLSLDESTDREDLFLKPQRTLDELKKLHPKLSVRRQPRRKETDWPGLAHLERYLFCNPREVKPVADTKRIEIIAAAGQKAEIEALARRIKKLLVLGDEENGNRPVHAGDIAMVFRSVEPLAPLVEEVFTENGIPAVIDAPTRLNRSPLLQALVAILRLQAADWPFRQLLAVVLNNYFRPDWTEWQEGKTAAAVEWAVRQVQLPKGCKTLLSALERLAKSDSVQVSDSATTADGDPEDEMDIQRKRQHRQRYAVAQAVLNRLAKVLPLPDKARPLSDWLGILQRIVDDLGLLRSAEDSADATSNLLLRSRYDQQAWQQLKNVLSAANQLQRWLEIQPEALTLSQFIARLQDILSIEQLPLGRDAVGKVRILSAPSVRAIAVPHLFVAGMAEKDFPPSARDDRIYSEAEYRRFSEAGLHFVGARERSSDEMLLFYEVITRATQRLTLSYPALDESAQPLLASPYLTELERSCGENKITHSVDISLSPVPQHDHPFGPTERRTKAVAELVKNNPRRLAEILADDSQIRHPDSPTPDSSCQTPMLTTSIVAALQAIAARRQPDFGPFEGLLTGNAAKQRLHQQFGPAHCWSVSRLEEYSYCPFQFFSKNVLGLEELPELSLEIDFGRRGQLAHEALATLHRRLNFAGKSRSPAEASDEYAQLAGGAIELLQERISQGSPLEIALRTVDLRLIAQWLQEYIGQHVKYDEAIAAINQQGQEQALRPSHFEVSFGLKPRTNEELDPLSTETPFELICDGDAVRFSGRIDRIDIGMVGSEVVFNILDYKTGSSKSFKSRNLELGMSLQLPLYALAVQELLMIDRRAVPWRVGFWFLKEKGFDAHGLPQFFERAEVGLRETANWHTLRGTLLNRVASLVRGIRSGNFPVFNLDDQCTGHCPYRTVCRIGQIRSLDKTWSPATANSSESTAASPAALAEAQT